MARGQGVHGRRDGHCSGRYASDLNAFLFTFNFPHLLLPQLQAKKFLDLDVFVKKSGTFLTVSL